MSKKAKDLTKSLKRAIEISSSRWDVSSPQEADPDRLKNAKAQQRVKDPRTHRYQLDTGIRVALAIWTSLVVTGWLTGVVFVLFLNKKLGLSDTVIGVLLGTTTFNVLILSQIVLKGLFGSSEPEGDEGKEK